MCVSGEAGTFFAEARLAREQISLKKTLLLGDLNIFQSEIDAQRYELIAGPASLL